MVQDLTHSGAVNIDLLGSGGLVIQIKRSIIQIERGVLFFGTRTAGILGLEAGEDAALGSIEARILHTRAGVDGDDAESVGLGAGESRGRGCKRGSEENVLDLHDGGVGLD